MMVSQTLESGSHRLSARSRAASVAALVVLSPLVGEYLFGNVAIDALVLLLVFAPMYGGGALLIREVTRRMRRGWPTMVLLALAYGFIEEGLVTQLLFNPSYSTYGVELTGPTYVPFLGINVVMTLSVLALHTVWSICVPIAIVEAFHGPRRTEPWLGTAGLAVVGIVFVLGSVYIARAIAVDENFVASMPQLLGVGAVSGGLIAIALAQRHRPLARVDARAPSPWTVGLASLVATSALMMLNVWTLGRELTREGPLAGWVSVAFSLLLVAVSVVQIVRWSRCESWGEAHQLALAGGALLTYAWIAFPQEPVVGSTGTIDFVGNVIFFAGALALLAGAARALQRNRDAEPAARTRS